MKKVMIGLLTAAALTAGVCAAEYATRPAALPEGCVRLALSHSEDPAAGSRAAMGEEVETEWVADVVICPGVPGSVGGPRYGGTLFFELKEAD
jgi:hypothetical protein